MFALTDDDLHGTILDCPGGASEFTAVATAAGATALAADPIYDQSIEALAQLVAVEADRGNAHTVANSSRYSWEFFGDAEGHRRVRRASARTFAQDLRAFPERYVSAALPTLPFKDDEFDLVLSSHFLFTYTDRLDSTFHREALLELHRVCRGEVRVFPLIDHAGRPLTALVDQLREALADLGMPTEVQRVDYEFQRGGSHMLVVGNAGS
ncbi:methyltransferase domain-containing protein [Epidermidibacterium keratini]|uniref:Methyltransferase domain-containing protein n=2 Tax=Epidermidibacterium keratini TaxID=1891644 RepID=A0A7L4YVV2_9ACTN|nr:methyltransferase domain-containing protein [Epidermidibacterium keratini]